MTSYVVDVRCDWLMYVWEVLVTSYVVDVRVGGVSDVIRCTFWLVAYVREETCISGVVIVA